MTIRRATVKDINGINALLRQVLEIHADIRPDLFIAGTKKYTDPQLEAIINDDNTPIFVAADENDDVLGYCFCVINHYTGLVNMPDHDNIYIDDLCIDHRARGQHIGKALYEHVLEYARSIGCFNVTLNVWEGNDSAKAFYEKMGMKVQKTVMETVL